MKLHILAIGVHPDDVELGCSGTLINHVGKGQQVGILDLTQGELGSRGSIQSRFEEAHHSAELMNIAVRENLKLRDGFFKNDEAHQMEIIRFLRRFQPDIVLANALEDRHPDHGRAGKLIADACFLSGLRKIETEWEGNNQPAWRPKRVFHYIQDRLLSPDFIVDVSASFNQKLEAIRCFKTQFFPDGSKDPETYISKPGFLDKIISRAALLGQRIGVEYGEGFICTSETGITDLDQLIYPEMP
jgi:bacillithiol biosynthesis deacetylase BshB1